MNTSQGKDSELSAYHQGATMKRENSMKVTLSRIVISSRSLRSHLSNGERSWSRLLRKIKCHPFRPNKNPPTIREKKIKEKTCFAISIISSGMATLLSPVKTSFQLWVTVVTGISFLLLDKAYRSWDYLRIHRRRQVLSKFSQPVS